MPVRQVQVELGWGSGEAVWHVGPDQAERDAAWELYVELVGLPRVSRTADFVSIYAASCEFRYSVRTSCGVR